MFRETKTLENMIIFIPEKVLIYTCVEMPVMPVIFLAKFFNLLLHKVQFPLWKTKYFLGQFMTADDMHHRSTCRFSKCRGLLEFPSCLAPFFVTLKILISCGYPLPSLSVKHYLVGNNFLTQIIHAYANTVDRDQVNVNKKISKYITYFIDV